MSCDHLGVRVVASEPAVDLVQEHGGRLYIWLRRGRCCGNTTTLAAATEAPAGKQFRRVEADTTFELYLPVGLSRVPDELHLDTRRYRRRVEAYWNGCAWVI